eukprot:15478878-Alexandrium_andersonii.AAC.2
MLLRACLRSRDMLLRPRPRSAARPLFSEGASRGVVLEGKASGRSFGAKKGLRALARGVRFPD